MTAAESRAPGFDFESKPGLATEERRHYYGEFMTTAALREQSINRYLGLAGRVERLLGTDPGHTLLNGVAIGIWQDTYAEEICEVVARRDLLLDPQRAPAIGSELVGDWIDFAEQTLKPLPKS